MSTSTIYRKSKPDALRVPKGRKVVAMGVSPWFEYRERSRSPEGAKGLERRGGPFVPSGLRRAFSAFHGLAPMATAFRRFAAEDGSSLIEIPSLSPSPFECEYYFIEYEYDLPEKQKPDALLAPKVSRSR